MNAPARTSTAQGDAAHPAGKGLVVIAALGVVFGDIGTSPLYAFKETLNPEHGVPFSPDAVLGLLSLIFWGLLFVVTLKYVVLVLRADNEGEGGLVAMLALASRAVADKPRLRHLLLVIGIFGTSLFYGDGVITPAISVLSAVEGLEVVSPHFKHYVIPITLVVLFCLFAVQKHGTAGIGRFFGPITLVWFLSLAVLGVWHIVDHPEILKALSPFYALKFIWDNPGTSFILLGAIVLCVTGAEALYADLGHFGKAPIRIAWFTVVMPALILNYFGQGALLLANPEAVKNPFFMMAPEWALIPLVLLATASTVIASQALITGAFSVTRQVIQLGYLPRLNIEHTSVRTAGQIYIPLVNWGLFVAIVLAVVMFRSSSSLAAAYGIAVTTDMLITTVLTFFVIRYAWKLPLALCIASTAAFFFIDFMFFASNLLKLPEGGWFPLVIGGAVFVLMITWKEGRRLMGEVQRSDAIELKAFLDSVFENPPVRVDGTAVFLTAEPGVVPNALLHNLKHNKVLHEQVIVLRVLPCDTPRVDARLRIEAESLMTGIWIVTARHGFMERPDVPEFIRILAYQKTLAIDSMKTSYFVSRASVGEEHLPGLNPIRRALFGWLQRNAGRASDYFELPDNRLVEMGQRT
jgi:KUP system potassium uptake protein